MKEVWIITAILLSLLPLNCYSSAARNLSLATPNQRSISQSGGYANELPQHLTTTRLPQSRARVISLSFPAPKSPSVSLSRMESDIIREMNRVRSNPPAYERDLLMWRRQFSGRSVRLSGRVFLQTQEGTSAVDEAILFVRKTRPVPTLQFSPALTLAARDFVRDQGMRGTTGHYSSDGKNPFQRMERYGKLHRSAGENIAYGSDTAHAVVRDLIVDDGVRDRGHRQHIFQPRFRLVGVACGYHRHYRVMCDINYAGG